MLQFLVSYDIVESCGNKELSLTQEPLTPDQCKKKPNQNPADLTKTLSGSLKKNSSIIYLRNSVYDVWMDRLVLPAYLIYFATGL